MDGGAWWAAVHGVAKNRTQLSDFPFTFHFHALEKELATHSSVLAWRIPGTGEPGGLPSMGSHRVGHDWSDLAVAAWRREWPSTPAFLPGEFPRQRSLVGYSPWGHKGSEMTDRHEVLQPNNLLKFLWTLILLFLSSPLLLSVFLTKSYRNIEQKWKITSNRDLGLSL